MFALSRPDLNLITSLSLRKSIKFKSIYMGLTAPNPENHSLIISLADGWHVSETPAAQARIRMKLGDVDIVRSWRG